MRSCSAEAERTVASTTIEGTPAGLPPGYPDCPYPVGMCRNITELRGLEPVATAEEIEAAARQYVRKVSGIQTLSHGNRDAFERAVTEVSAATTRLLATLPARKQPPANIPPLRRPEVRARIAARQAAQAAAKG